MVDELAAVAARIRGDALPPEILDKVRLHALDAFGAMFAGAQTAEGIASRAPFLRMAFATNRPLGSGPACTAAILSLSCRLTECDDIHLHSCTTPGSVVYAAALATTALIEVDSAAAAEAVVAGYEVMAALGVAANGAEVVYGDTWPTYLAAAMTSAAVAVKFISFEE
jgi:2-methylcitrate dehydratase PrpD